MTILLIRKKASPAQITDMLSILGDYIKLAVDIDRQILAGGGALHADCELVLLEAGSQQESIWGADWIPSSRKVHFEALINLRPRQHNMSMTIQDSAIREQVEQIARNLLEEA